MKALVQISFAIDDLDDDDLVKISNTIGVAIRDALEEALGRAPEGVDAAKLDTLVDWYGTSISLRQSLVEVQT